MEVLEYDLSENEREEKSHTYSEIEKLGVAMRDTPKPGAPFKQLNEEYEETELKFIYLPENMTVCRTVATRGRVIGTIIYKEYEPKWKLIGENKLYSDRFGDNNTNWIVV